MGGNVPKLRVAMLVDAEDRWHVIHIPCLRFEGRTCGPGLIVCSVTMGRVVDSEESGSLDSDVMATDTIPIPENGFITSGTPFGRRWKRLDGRQRVIHVPFLNRCRCIVKSRGLGTQFARTTFGHVFLSQGAVFIKINLEFHSLFLFLPFSQSVFQTEEDGLRHHGRNVAVGALEYVLDCPPDN